MWMALIVVTALLSRSAVADLADAGAAEAEAPRGARALSPGFVPNIARTPDSVVAAAAASTPKWKDAAVPAAERAADLVGKLTLGEKLTLLSNKQQAVPRLGLKAFDFLTECLHGLWETNPYTKQPPTIFPQPLVMASTFDRLLVKRVFDAVSTEMRAKNNFEVKSKGVSRALTCWTPHMNILRDPRWGRGSETWGEDPHLSSVMAAHVVRGLQGEDPTYVKVAATCKHFYGYSFEMADGQSRYSFNARIDPVDAADTYLPAFDACIRAARTQGVMCAYNAVDGVPMCANKPKLQGLLRDKWGFDGYVVSDCNAVQGLVWGHKTARDEPAAIAQAIKAGTDLLCDNMDSQKAASQALSQGLLTEADIDSALNHTMGVRIRTGQFDPPSSMPWAGAELDKVNSAGHKELARSVARKGIVLLKNEPALNATSRMLPLANDKLKKVCVVGPLADSAEHMMGNYYGAWDKGASTPLAAIKAELAGATVAVTTDNTMRTMAWNYYDWPLESALQSCDGADAALVFLGASIISTPLTPAQKDSRLSYRPVSEGEGFDREGLGLPGRQLDLVKALARRSPATPIALVVMNGGPVDLSWAQGSPSVAAIMAAGFPGQEGGRAVSDLLFGRASPSGRLPNTWYREAFIAAAPMEEFGMRPDAAKGYPGRTYRFVEDPKYVLYPFGHGLSYATFSYSALSVAPTTDAGGKCAGYDHAAYCVSVTVRNTGAMAGEEVVLLYVSHAEKAGTGGYPLRSLRAFTRTRALAPGESRAVVLPLRTADFTLPRPEDGALVARLGTWRAQIGGLTVDVPIARGQLDLSATTAEWPAQAPAGGE